MTLPAKRKRAQISYAELELHEFDDGLDDDIGEEDDQVTEDDGIRGSRKQTLRKSTTVKKPAGHPAAKNQPPSKPFPFLSLAPELRDYIYELALTDRGGITLVSGTQAYRRIVKRGEVITQSDRRRDGVHGGSREATPAQCTTLSPNLLAVNRQVHAESVGWLYCQPLILEDTKALHTFLAAIGPRQRRLVTKISVRGWGGGRGTLKAMNVAALTALADCADLESFRLDCNIGWFRRPKDLARQLYRDGHYFFEALAAVTGKKDAVLDVLQVSDENFEKERFYDWRGFSSVPKLEECKEAFNVEMRNLLGCAR